MNEALRLARKAFAQEEVPVGAVVVRGSRIIARAFNQVELPQGCDRARGDARHHAGRSAVGDWRLNDCDLYVTKEPCAMCAGALVHVRMRRVIFRLRRSAQRRRGGTINLLQCPHSITTARSPPAFSRRNAPGSSKLFFRRRRRAEIPDA